MTMDDAAPNDLLGQAHQHLGIPDPRTDWMR